MMQIQTSWLTSKYNSENANKVKGNSYFKLWLFQLNILKVKVNLNYFTAHNHCNKAI